MEKNLKRLGVFGIISLLSYTAVVFNAVLGINLMNGTLSFPAAGEKK